MPADLAERSNMMQQHCRFNQDAWTENEPRPMQSGSATLLGPHAAQHILHNEHRKKEDVWPFGLTDEMLLCN